MGRKKGGHNAKKIPPSDLPKDSGSKKKVQGARKIQLPASPKPSGTDTLVTRLY